MVLKRAEMPPVPLGDVLCQSSSPIVKAWLASIAARTGSSSSADDWRADHSLLFSELSSGSLRPAKEIDLQDVHGLTQREQDVVRYFALKHPRGAEMDSDFVDLYFNLLRSSKRKPLVGRLPCILPQSKIWMRFGATGRLLVPDELFAAQGMWLQEHGIAILPRAPAPDPPQRLPPGCKVARLSFHEAANLAGNAFNGFAALAALVCLFTGVQPPAADLQPEPFRSSRAWSIMGSDGATRASHGAALVAISGGRMLKAMCPAHCGCFRLLPTRDRTHSEACPWQCWCLMFCFCECCFCWWAHCFCLAVACFSPPACRTSRPEPSYNIGWPAQAAFQIG